MTQGVVHQLRRRDGRVINYTYDGSAECRHGICGSRTRCSYGYDNLGHATPSRRRHTTDIRFDGSGSSTQTVPQDTFTSDYDVRVRRESWLTWPDYFYVDYEYLVTGDEAVRSTAATTVSACLRRTPYDT